MEIDGVAGQWFWCIRVCNGGNLGFICFFLSKMTQNDVVLMLIVPKLGTQQPHTHFPLYIYIYI